MFRFVRFIPKADPTAEPRYGLIKGFHFSVDRPSQVLTLVGSPFEDLSDEPEVRDDIEPVAMEEIQLLTPVQPSKILGIGLNYSEHALEQSKPLPEVPYVFFKATSSLSNPNAPIRLNRHCTMVHFEGELVIVIGSKREGDHIRKCKNVTEAEALDFVAGYTIANDVSDRTIQKAELSYARAKGMDTFCPIGPHIVRGIDWKGLSIKTWLNGELRQSGTTNTMIHGVPKIISFVSEFMTLEPGDVILTGTPAGVGQIKPGDKVRIEIDQLGVLENAVERDN